MIIHTGFETCTPEIKELAEDWKEYVLWKYGIKFNFLLSTDFSESIYDMTSYLYNTPYGIIKVKIKENKSEFLTPLDNQVISIISHAIGEMIKLIPPQDIKDWEDYRDIVFNCERLENLYRLKPQFEP